MTKISTGAASKTGLNTIAHTAQPGPPDGIVSAQEAQLAFTLFKAEVQLPIRDRCPVAAGWSFELNGPRWFGVQSVKITKYEQDLNFNGEFRSLKTELEAQINAFVERGEADALAAGRQLERAVDLWTEMNTAERCEFLHVFLEAVYVDVVRKEIVGVAVKPAFRHLFAAGEGSLKAASAPQ
jgi:hypothetical protein